MESKVTSRIKDQLDGVNYFKEDDWPKMIEFLIDGAIRMHKAFKQSIQKI